MDAELLKIREVQKEAWNKSSGGWKKWDQQTMSFMRPTSERMIEMLNPGHKDKILDIATGTGEPGLTLAQLVKNGTVTGTDLSADMLEVAKEKAAGMRLNNFSLVCCDACNLPFPDEHFDSVVCRFGFMFFPDMDMALNEMIRVLKPGGGIVVSVWGQPEQNSWITTMMNIMIEELQLKLPPPGGPGPFRCAGEGIMAMLFSRNKLKNIREVKVNGLFECDSLETYWNFISEVASPLAFKNSEEAVKQKIKEIVMDTVRQNNPSEPIRLESGSIVIAASK